MNKNNDEEMPKDLAIIFTTMVMLCLLAVVGLVFWKLILNPLWNWAT